MAASIGAVLLSYGQKYKSGWLIPGYDSSTVQGAQGQASDIEITTRNSVP